MSGQVVLYDHEKDETLEEQRDHSKYVVKFITHQTTSVVHWIATAGWDGKILVCVLQARLGFSSLALGPPVAAISLPTNPKAAVFVEGSDDPIPMLVITRRDSTSLHYYSLTCR